MESINKKDNYFNTKRLVGMAMFAALAYAVTFVFRIPVMFLTFDAKDAVTTIAALMYGPVSGVIISFLVAFIEAISISGTGVYGFIMNFASSAAFSATAALIYKYKKNSTIAILSFFAASVVMVSVMISLNMFVTPYYMGADMSVEEARAQVVALIPTLFLPFNIAKALLNSAIAMILYKPVSVAMKRAHLVKGEAKMSFNRSSVAVIITATLTLVCAVIMFVILTK